MMNMFKHLSIQNTAFIYYVISEIFMTIDLSVDSIEILTTCNFREDRFLREHTMVKIFSF